MEQHETPLPVRRRTSLEKHPEEYADLRTPHDLQVEEDYFAMKNWLPEKVKDVLDIGCGNPPRIDVWLGNHYGANTNIHLMDGEKRIRPIGKEQVGYNKHGTQPWKSRHEAVLFLQDRLPNCKIYSYPANPSLLIPCDLIISRRAWGHHFPVKTYIALARASLRREGRIVVDIRRETDGIETFERSGFKVISPNLEVRSYKCHRWVLTWK